MTGENLSMTSAPRIPKSRNKIFLSERYETDNGLSNELSNQHPKSVVANGYFKGRNTRQIYASQGRKRPGDEYLKPK